MNSELEAINERIKTESGFIDSMETEIRKVIVGQKYLIERLLIGLLADGHILLEGVPGLAKTLAIKTMSDTIKTLFHRIQFTPDLLPADLIGTLIYNQAKMTFETRKGPVFANIILADEINRAPAKVQSALLESMQERQVSIGDTTYKLPDPFMVLATQNPIEQQGTYPLPEAQVDRFIMKLVITYPVFEEEREIMRVHSKADLPTAKQIVEPDAIVRARRVVRDIYVDPKVEDYILNIVFASRFPDKYGMEDLKGIIAYGASPRASLFLRTVSQARAFLQHRGFVTPEDVRAIALDVLRHRIILTFEAEAEEMTSEDVIRKILNTVEVP